MHFSNSHRNGNSMAQKAAHSIYCAFASHFPIWFWNVKNLSKERRQCIHERPDLFFNCVYLLTSLLFPMSQKQSTTHTLMDVSPCPSGQQSNTGRVSNKDSVGQLALGSLSWEFSKGFLKFHYKTSTDMEVTAPALTMAFLAPHVLLQRGFRHRRTYPASKPLEKNTAICFYGFWLRHEVVLTESPEKFVGIPDTDIGTLIPICCSDGSDLSCSR